MKYVFNRDSISLSDRICNLNNINIERLNMDGFKVDYNLKPLLDFKNKLIENNKLKYLIVGDYDCDGICATTIIKKLLDDLNINNNYYIPSRIKEGYGLNNKIVKTAIDNHFDALLLVDNGVSAYEQLKYAKENNLKIFIIDHHEFKEEVICDCLLHPCLFDGDYFDMCAGGLASLLSNSIRYDELSIAYGGLATLADMVSVLGFNRYLLKEMIKIFNQNNIYPITYLLGRNKVDYDSLSFNVIPKINAVSRLDEYLNVNYLVQYLLADETKCVDYFNKIEMINNTRKELTKNAIDYINSIILEDENIIVIKSKEYKEGLCGLIANILMNKYQKAVVILSEDNELLKGSGRAPLGTNLYEYLLNFKDYFLSFGGHAQAIGVSMSLSSFESFLADIKKKPIDYVENYIDVISIKQDDINNELLDELDKLKPFGKGFLQPLFAIENVNVNKTIVIKNKYPKYLLNDHLSSISFNSDFINKPFNTIIGKLKADDYAPNKQVLLIEDLI